MLKFNLTKEQAEKYKNPELANKPIYRKAITSIERKVNMSERSLVHIISSSRPDRGRDVLVPTGMKTKDFKQNPIVPWAHNYGELPIARSAWTKVQENEVIAKTIFNDTEKAEEIWNYVKDNIIGWSVGLTIDKIIDKWDDEFDEAFNDLVEAGYLKKKDKDKVTWIISEWTLVEYSAVTVPAQPDAVGGGPGIILFEDEPTTELVHVLDENNEPVEKEAATEEAAIRVQESIELIGSAVGIKIAKTSLIEEVLSDLAKGVEKVVLEKGDLDMGYDVLEKAVEALTDENKALKEAAQEPEDILDFELEPDDPDPDLDNQVDLKHIKAPTEPEPTEPEEKPITEEDVIKIAIEVGNQIAEKNEGKVLKSITDISDTVNRALGRVTL